MLMAARLSVRLGWLDEAGRLRIERLLDKARLPARAPEGMRPEQFLERMAVDKKTRAGRLHLVLLRGIGQAVLTADFPASKLEDVLQEFCGT